LSFFDFPSAALAHLTGLKRPFFCLALAKARLNRLGDVMVLNLANGITKDPRTIQMRQEGFTTVTINNMPVSTGSFYKSHRRMV
jgi:hypothetical protein